MPEDTLPAEVHPLVALTADWYWEQDADLRFTFISPRQVAAAGLEPGDYVGLRRWDSPSHGVTEAEWAGHRARLEAREPFRDFVVGRYRPDGTPSYASVSGWPVFDAAGRFAGYHGIGRDVTRLVETERALRESERRYRLLVDTSPDAIFLLCEGRIAYTNPAGVALYGARDAAALVGSHILDHVHPEDRTRVAERVKVLMEDVRAVPRTVIRQLRADGTSFHADVASTPFEVDGRPGSLTVVRDVSERVRAEREILDLNANLEARVRERTAELEQALGEIEAFGHSMAHDLRAPLRAIHGHASLLAEEQAATLDDEGRRRLARIREAAERMNRLIDDLLRLSQASHAPLSPRPLDLSAMAAQVVADLRAAEPARDVRVDVEPGVTAWGDPALVAVALQNLVENAWKFTSRREGAQIAFGAARDGEGGLCFYVRDNGAGFDMRQAARLFEAFERLHDAREYPGTGIGLATVQRVVARHGGRIWAAAAPGTGATFHFTLPDAPAP